MTESNLASKAYLPPPPNTPTELCKTCGSANTYWKYYHISAPAGFDSDDDQYDYERECRACDDFYGFKHEARVRTQIVQSRNALYADSMIDI